MEVWYLPPHPLETRVHMVESLGAGASPSEPHTCGERVSCWRGVCGDGGGVLGGGTCLFSLFLSCLFFNSLLLSRCCLLCCDLLVFFTALVPCGEEFLCDFLRAEADCKGVDFSFTAVGSIILPSPSPCLVRTSVGLQLDITNKLVQADLQGLFLTHQSAILPSRLGDNNLDVTACTFLPVLVFIRETIQCSTAMFESG